MATDPWVMAVWPKVVHRLVPVPVLSDTWPCFQHRGTRITDSGDSRSGDTFWVTQIDGQDVGLAWHWLELVAGVVVHADPNGIYTNLRIVGADGATPVDELQSILALNTLVHELPWQAVVMDQVGWQLGRGERENLAQAPAAALHTQPFIAKPVDERLLLQAA
jgi:hypothetical protein